MTRRMVAKGASRLEARHRATAKDRSQTVDVGRRRELTGVPGCLFRSHVAGVPMTAKESVRPLSSPGLAKPKSVIWGSPCSSNRTLLGFKSRWRIPRSWV